MAYEIKNITTTFDENGDLKSVGTNSGTFEYRASLREAINQNTESSAKVMNGLLSLINEKFIIGTFDGTGGTYADPYPSNNISQKIDLGFRPSIVIILLDGLMTAPPERNNVHQILGGIITSQDENEPDDIGYITDDGFVVKEYGERSYPKYYYCNKSNETYTYIAIK